GNNASNVITGGAGDDVLSGLGGHDTLNGGAGNDTLLGGSGNDTVNYRIGDGADSVGGGAGSDTLNVTGGAADETLAVVYADGVLTSLEGGALTGVESVNANLLDGADTLSYAGSTESVTVNLATLSASGFNSIAGIENVTGGSGNDQLTGDASANNLNGGAGADSVNGGEGDDTVNYSIGDGADAVDGGAGNDTLNVTGGATDDTLAVVYSAGVLTSLQGGALTGVESVNANLLNGADTLSYAGSSDNVAVNLATLSASGFNSIAGVENVTGGSGNDNLTGSAGANTLDGGAGNDTLSGGAGDDIVNGGDGDDTVNYAIGDGADTLDGGAGSDMLNVTGTSAEETLDVVYAGGMLTSVEGGPVSSVESVNADLQDGADTLNYAGTAEDLTVNLAAGTASGFASIAGVENATGGSGNDSLTGNSGANVLDGGAGNDTLSGGAGDDTIQGGAGGDIVNYTLGDGADAVDGGDGSDTLNVTGTAADETLAVAIAGGVLTNVGGISVTNVDQVNANLSGGIDTLSYAGVTEGITVNLGAGEAIGFASIAGIENVTGGSGNDSLTGSADANALDGGAGNDTLSGGAGADVVDGGEGDDTVNYSIGEGADAVDGGDGSDTLNVSGSGADEALNVVYASGVLTNLEGGTVSGVESVNANLQDGADTLSYAGSTDGVTVNLDTASASGFSSIAGVENVTGGSGNDNLTGSAGANTLDGGAGNDTFSGGAGDDIVNGGEGDDTVNYSIGDGADAVDGGAGNDTLNVTGGATDDTLAVVYSAGVLTSLQGGALTGVESVNANLLNGADTLSYAGSSDNVAVNLDTLSASGFNSIGGIENVTGGSGNDMLTGAAGVINTLAGGAGDDTYVVHDTGDFVSEGIAAGTDEVRSLAVSYTLNDFDVENLTFIGAGNFTGTGNNASNVITGGAGDDVLSGLGGHDTLNGGAGNDTLLGGSGNDTVNYRIGDGTDVVDGGAGTDTLSYAGNTEAVS
ncbi:hypothetical protein EZ313_23120, partial [Ramlibacter henchirensis]